MEVLAKFFGVLGVGAQDHFPKRWCRSLQKAIKSVIGGANINGFKQRECKIVENVLSVAAIDFCTCQSTQRQNDYHIALFSEGQRVLHGIKVVFDVRCQPELPKNVANVPREIANRPKSSSSGSSHSSRCCNRSACFQMKSETRRFTSVKSPRRDIDMPQAPARRNQSGCDERDGGPSGANIQKHHGEVVFSSPGEGRAGTLVGWIELLLESNLGRNFVDAYADFLGGHLDSSVKVSRPTEYFQLTPKPALLHTAPPLGHRNGRNWLKFTAGEEWWTGVWATMGLGTSTMADPVAGKSAPLKMYTEVKLIHAAARTQDLGDDFAASSHPGTPVAYTKRNHNIAEWRKKYPFEFGLSDDALLLSILGGLAKP
ncbi:hypothetical protein DFH08DRAFT_815735 [Mycena albidolilacea]|uniref:Uncharacterized protein n=1 Tax=Mycena albidolilacea TaxID=1033008 RepID=A0AAD6ZN48_9AGAR|nr:hypothetical protein DFH08DRAFT_815735 [Mycena albidolilacea]